MRVKTYKKNRYFMVEFENEPTLRWLHENNVAFHLKDEYFKRKENRNTTEECEITKHQPCLNKNSIF